jgi:hypothetical protein
VSREFAIFDYDEVTAEFLKGRLDRPAAPAIRSAPITWMCAPSILPTSGNA